MNIKKNDKRCRSILLSAPLCILCLSLLTVCSGKTTAASPQSNQNSNGIPHALAFYTEETTPISVRRSAVNGLEVPSLQTGDVDAFVVHTLPDGTLNYCMGYNRALKANCWTAYKWYGGYSSNEKVWRRSNWRKGESFNDYGGKADPFQPDPVIPKKYRLNSGNFGKGYHRGHILGSADRLNSKEANGQTFYYSNMHPQLPDFNGQGIWYNLEDFLRDVYDVPSFRDTLYVVKGGTISEGNYKKINVKGSSYLVCPNHFYMAILVYHKRYARHNGGYQAIAFWMPHKNNSDKVSARFAISVDELERRTGIDFFCNLPDEIEEKVERSFHPSDWYLK